MKKIPGFYDAAHVARRLGVPRDDVMKWTNSPTANFPIPVAVLIQDSGKDRPIWADHQVPDLRAWLAKRLDLSDPVSHWALIDNGGKPAGGHQDQMQMFDILADEVPDDALFPVGDGAA